MGCGSEKRVRVFLNIVFKATDGRKEEIAAEEIQKIDLYEKLLRFSFITIEFRERLNIVASIL